MGKSQGGGKTEWKDGGDLKSANLATVSQLAVARPGQDRSNLRVYYQDQTNNVREITYFERRGNWSVSPQMFPTARAGTSISAVSAKPPGDVRLYFQGDNNKLREWFMNGRNNGNQNPWSSGKSIFPWICFLFLHKSSFHSSKPLTHVIGAIGDFTLDAGAPINAICWYDDMTDPKNPQNLNINVFTIADKPSEAAQLSYSSDQGWDSSPSFVANIYRTSTESSAIGTCQVTGNKKGAIHVFYQPESQVIDLKPVAISAGSAGAAEVQAVVLPKGIPTVRWTSRAHPFILVPNTCADSLEKLFLQKDVRLNGGHSFLTFFHLSRNECFGPVTWVPQIMVIPELLEAGP